MIIVIVVVLLVVLVFGPQLWIRLVMHHYGAEIPGMPGTGGEFAEHLAERFDLGGLKVERTDDWRDHYDPGEHTVRLGSSNYDGKSLTAVAVAAHEVGHAIQYHEGNAVIRWRDSVYPRVRVAEQVGIAILAGAPLLGVLTRSPAPVALMVVGGLLAMSSRLVLHVVTLPMEWDASFGKALPIITQGRYVAPGEERAVRRVLRAAALTYVAAALADLLSIWRWLIIFRRGWI